MEQMERQTSADFLSHGCAGAQPFLIPIPATQSLSSRAESQGGRRSQICHQNSLLYSTWIWFCYNAAFPRSDKFKLFKSKGMETTSETTDVRWDVCICSLSFKPQNPTVSQSAWSTFAVCNVLPLFSVPSLHNIVLEQITQKWISVRLKIWCFCH